MGGRECGILNPCITLSNARFWFSSTESSTPGPFLKAAVLAERIIRGHPFTDGNKRTGYLSEITMLELLAGLTVEADEDQVVEVCLAVEDARMSAEDLASWMFDHAEPIVDAFGDW